MNLGRMLIVLGLLLTVLGMFVSLGVRRLPGDIVIRGKHSVFYFPIVTCLLISAVLSLVMWMMNRR